MLSKLRTFFITCSILSVPEISESGNNQIIFKFSLLILRYKFLKTKAYVEINILLVADFRRNFNRIKKC